MKTILMLLSFLVCSTASAQFGAARDTLNYADSSSITTTWSRIYLGPSGVQKHVTMNFDVTSSTLTVLFLVGAAADTNNPAKKNVVRLAFNQKFVDYFTTKDTLRMKTLGGSVPSSVISRPTPLYGLSR